MRLWKLGTNGEPIGDPIMVIGAKLPLPSFEIAEPLEPILSTAPLSISFSTTLSEEQVCVYLELLGYADIADEWRAERAAFAVWEGEGGWCG